MRSANHIGQERVMSDNRIFANAWISVAAGIKGIQESPPCTIRHPPLLWIWRHAVGRIL